MQISSRSQLRKTLLTQRSSLTYQQQQHASKVIAKKIFQMPEFLRSKRIAFYVAFGREISPLLILNKALSLNKECFLPILHPVKHNHMLFGSYQLGDELKKNSFGIEEPDLQNVNTIPAWSLDLVLVPLVGFDLQGNRLGMGGGYYDRTFAFLSQRMRTNPQLIGLAYEFQQVDNVFPETWDIPLYAIVTENKAIIVNAE